jgi:hypothetical protein
MIKAATLLVLLLFAGIAAAGGMGSAPAPSHPLHFGALRASFHTVICTPKRKTHCVKPKKQAVKTRTVTVVRQHTVTETATTTTVQTVTATQTQVVTAAAPAATLLPGPYSGLTQNFGSLSFVVAGSAGAFVVQQIGINEVDATCILSSTEAIGHLAIYNVSFPDPSPLDAGGRFSASGTAKYTNGDSLTVTFSGTIATNGNASGTVASSGNLSAGSGNHWACDSSSKWTAARG